jgi:hypothetical protein
MEDNGMGTRGRIAGLLGDVFCLQSLMLGLCLGERAYGGLAPGAIPQGSGQSTTRATDEAYYLSTAYVQQAVGALYARPKSEATPQWGCFEAVVTNAAPYGNPFEDVTLDVKLTKPDGTIVDFWGFYDGQEMSDGSPSSAGTWRIRVMPDQTGTWHYEAKFSDGSSRTSGAFLCVGPASGAISPSQARAGGPHSAGAWPPGLVSPCKSNPIWFGFKGNRAVLVRSLQVGDRFLADTDNAVTGQSWSPAKRRVFLDWAQEQGYNMLAVPDCFSNDNTQGRGRGWNTPTLWDARRQQPNCGEYRRLEAVLDDLANRQMLVYPVGGFLNRSSSFPADEAKQNVYIRYTLARLGSYWNLLLNAGGTDALRVPDFGESIRKRFASEFASVNPEDSICRVLEGPAATNLSLLNRFVSENRSATRPLYAIDSLWPGSAGHPQYTQAELRKCAYVLIMSGATINFADLSGGIETGLSGTLDLKQKVQTRHDILKGVWDYFDRIPFWRLKPRPDLVDAGYCLAEPGQRYVVYLPWRGTAMVNIEPGSYQVVWINARDTSDARKSGIIESRRALTSPQEQEDWILSLVRVEIINGGVQER